MTGAGTTPPQVWIAIGGVAVFSIAWMLTLVPFARAVIGGTRRARAGLRGWSISHGLAWCGLAGCMGWLFFSGGASDAHALENYFVGAAFLVGFPVIEGGLLWFGRSVQRAQARPAPGRAAPHPPPSPAAREETAAAHAAVAAPTPRRWHLPSGLIVLGAVLLLAWFAQNNRDVLGLHRHAALLLWVVVPLTICGGVAFMIGVLRLALATGRPMSREEVETLISTNKRVGASYARAAFKYRVLGDAVGLQSSETLSLSAVKRAWKTGAWKGSARWQGIFLMLGGGLVAVFAGFAIAVVTAPPIPQLIVAAALLYAATQLALAWKRA